MRKIKQDIYPISFYYCNTKRDFMKQTKSDICNSSGKCYFEYDYENKIETRIIIAVFDNKIGTLIHELQHAVIYLSDYIGMNINMQTSEAFCYFIDNILYKQCVKINKNFVK